MFNLFRKKNNTTTIEAQPVLRCTTCRHAKRCPFAMKVQPDWVCPEYQDMVKIVIRERLQSLWQRAAGTTVRLAAKRPVQIGVGAAAVLAGVICLIFRLRK